MTSPTPTAQSRTWPALDGVRAVALIGVMCAHLFPTGQVLGRTGVGLITFFTLSGFLITGLILKERERFGGLSYRLFYARRAVRLLPALFLVLLVLNALSVIAPGAIGDPPVEQNAKASVAAFFYVGNWYDLTGFTNIPQLGWLTHLWSLSVEEQFYLVWPVVLLLALRRSVGTALAVTSVMIVVSPVLRDVLYDGGAGGLRVARGTDTAADYVMWGCALALLQHRPAGPPAWLRRAGDTTALVGLAIIVSTVFMYRLDVEADAPYTISFLAPGSVLLIAGIVNSGRFVPWVLALPPLQLLGRMSYGIYLWHFPVFLAVQGEMVGRSVALTNTVKVAASLAIASLAYALVEKPINDHYRAKLRRTGPPAAMPAAPDPVPTPSALVPAARTPADTPEATPATVRTPRPKAAGPAEAPAARRPTPARRPPSPAPRTTAKTTAKTTTDPARKTTAKPAVEPIAATTGPHEAPAGTAEIPRPARPAKTAKAPTRAPKAPTGTATSSPAVPRATRPVRTPTTVPTDAPRAPRRSSEDPAVPQQTGTPVVRPRPAVRTPRQR